MFTKRSCVLHTNTHVHVAQLGLRIVFTAVWAQPPTVFERFEARRVRFERLSLPLGSNFRITAPPEHALVLSSLPIKSSKALDRYLSFLSPLDTDSKSWSNFCLWFCVFGEAKGLRNAAMRTSCRLPPPVFTPRTLASGVFLPLEPGVRPGVAVDLGVRLGVVARRGVRLGVREVDAPASSPSHIRPGVPTKHSSRENSLFLCSL